MDEDDETGGGEGRVGYRRPPVHTQFRKGQSGNPSGRRKGAGIRTAAEKVMGRKVMATVDGERRRVPISEAVLLQVTQKALTGEARAVREFLRIAEQVAAALPNGGRPERLVIERRIIDPQDCNPALDLLGIIIPVGERYRIAPWAVEAAMARKPRLSEADQILVGNSTLRAGERRREVTEEVGGS